MMHTISIKFVSIAILIAISSGFQLIHPIRNIGPFYSSLIPPSAIATINSGRIAVIDNFLPPSLLLRLQKDCRNLHSKGYFTPDALARYGVRKDGVEFDPTRDRTVFPCWVPSSSTPGGFLNRDFGDFEARGMLHDVMEGVKAELREGLEREDLGRGKAGWGEILEGAKRGVKPNDEIR